MRYLNVLLPCLIFSAGLYADVTGDPVDPLFIEHDIEHDGYVGSVVFTTGLENEYPIDKLESTSFDKKDLILFVAWANMEDRLYQKSMRAYDPYGALVNEWHYQFMPQRGVWYTWDQFEMGECITMPGTWRFEILMDGEIVLDTTFDIAEAGEVANVSEVEEIGVIEVN